MSEINTGCDKKKKKKKHIRQGKRKLMNLKTKLYKLKHRNFKKQ